MKMHDAGKMPLQKINRIAARKSAMAGIEEQADFFTAMFHQRIDLGVRFDYRADVVMKRHAHAEVSHLGRQLRDLGAISRPVRIGQLRSIGNWPINSVVPTMRCVSINDMPGAAVLQQSQMWQNGVVFRLHVFFQNTAVIPAGNQLELIPVENFP